MIRSPILGLAGVVLVFGSKLGVEKDTNKFFNVGDYAVRFDAAVVLQEISGLF